jgi:hypothetical protein
MVLDGKPRYSEDMSVDCAYSELTQDSHLLPTPGPTPSTSGQQRGAGPGSRPRQKFGKGFPKAGLSLTGQKF